MTPFLFPLLIFGVGWNLLARARRLDAEERFVSAWALGIALLGFGQLVAFWAGWKPGPAVLALALVLVGTATVVRLSTSVESRPLDPVLPLGWALFFLHLLALQALLPVYVGSRWYFDWWMHFDEARVFLGQRPVDVVWLERYNLASRTPLFNLAAAYGMSLAGSAFWVFQIASTVLNAAFVGPLYLVLRDLFGRRTARAGMLLAVVNIWLLHDAWYTWPKMLVAFYLLLALHFYLRFLRERGTDPDGARRSFRVCCAWSVVGFMVHQVALVYLAALLVHRAVLGWRRCLTDLAFLATCTLALAGPWYFWLTRTLGVRRVLGSTPVTQMSDDTPGFLGLAATVARNLYRSVVPVHLLETIGSGFAPMIDAATRMYFSLIPGLLTLTLSTALLIAALLKLRRCRLGAASAEWWAVWTFLILGAFAAAWLHPGPGNHGIAHNVVFPSAILGVGLAWGWWSGLPRRWALLILAGVLAEGLGMLWIHLWLVQTPEVLEPRNITTLLKSMERLEFLHDRLAPQRGIVMVLAAAIQIAAAVILIRLFSRDPKGSA